MLVKLTENEFNRLVYNQKSFKKRCRRYWKMLNLLMLLATPLSEKSMWKYGMKKSML